MFKSLYSAYVLLPFALVILANIRRFYKAHSNRQGIAVLAFEVGHNCLEEIFRRYSDLHPNLLPKEYKKGIRPYEKEAKVLEVFAYYREEKSISPADEGTLLRFIEPIESESSCKLPGIVPIHAKFHSSCCPAYFDHWVSNGKRGYHIFISLDFVCETKSR